MSAFGEVTYDTPPAEAATSHDAGTPSIDPNDPRLTSEVLTINPDADAYAVLPPLPDGKWRAKAKQVDIKDDKGQQQRYAVFSRAKMENGKPFFATNVEFGVIDHSGAFDGVTEHQNAADARVDRRDDEGETSCRPGRRSRKTEATAAMRGFAPGLGIAAGAPSRRPRRPLGWRL